MEEVVVTNERMQSTSASERLLAIFSIAATICMLGWLLWFCHYGFDFTDEGFYLNWIARPFNYPASSSQFGFLYHPLYLLVGGDIAAIRQANVLLSFGLGLGVTWVILGKVLYGRTALNNLSKLALASAIATSALLCLVFAGMWLPTPSYNSLAFQGLLVAAAGLVMADRPAPRAGTAGWILLGVGGWIVFMAKPTSAAALALISVLYLLFAGKLCVTRLAVAVGTALGLVICTAFSIDGSLMQFGQRLRGGVAIAQLVDSSHSLDRILRLDDLLLDARTKLLLLCLAGVIFCAVWLARTRVARSAYVTEALSAGCASLGLLIVFWFLPLGLVSGQWRGLLLCSAPIGASMAALSIYRINGLQQIRLPQWLLFFTLPFFPYAYAFGTGNNYWVPMAGAAIFFVLAGLLFLGPLASRPGFSSVLLCFSLSVQVISAALLDQGLASPYRQPLPLRQNNTLVDVGGGGQALMLAQSTAHYLSVAMSIANQSHFKRGSPMIDLTGHSPGLVYALGANSVGVAWALGGYPGSNEFVSEGLRQVPCEQLAVAWLITEPDSAFSISPKILSGFGANLTTDFETVGTINPAEGHAQFLQKPIRNVDAAVAACHAARGDRS